MRKEGISDGISRRDLLKLAAFGAISLTLPPYLLSGHQAEFSPSKGRGLIFLVGDGMPLGVIRAMHEIVTRVWNKEGTNLYSLMGEEGASVGYMGTKSLSSIVTDSAPASVAWATGSKTVNKMLASLPDGRPLKTIMELLKEEGYACGLVTTTRVTHATPAAWVSHQIERDSEEEIALDYLRFKPEILLGGGSKQFDPKSRKDGRDLFAEFAQRGYDIVKNKEAFFSQEIILSERPLLGVFNRSHISYYVDRVNFRELGDMQPTLAEMTAVALKKLSGNPKGFILQVEAGRIDHANHSNDAWGAIMDTLELDHTLGIIREFLRTNPNTLVILTSDHGNSGWGINGTGPEYNDATEALKKYTAIKASFEMIGEKMKGKGPQEIKEIFEHYTTYTLFDWEAEEIYKSMNSDYQPYPGDFLYYPDALLGRALAHSTYRKDEGGKLKASLRRGNVGFTSTNHTGEDQILLAFGHEARNLGLNRYVDNTYLFEAMCKYFGIKYKNPVMTEKEARSYIKISSLTEWQRHMKLHIS